MNEKITLCAGKIRMKDYSKEIAEMKRITESYNEDVLKLENEKSKEGKKMKLADVQNEKDERNKRIKKVGIREFYAPVNIKRKNDDVQSTIVNFSIYTSLNENVRGANMSRYAEIINEIVKNHVSLDVLKEILYKLKDRLEAEDGYVKMRFKYFIEKEAPVSKIKSSIAYDIIIEGRLLGDEIKIYLTVQVPYTSLCPCSKEISKYGAHNQRSTADVTVDLDEFVWIEDIVNLVEKLASSPVYSVLKRVDEKYVTELAYEKPMFVEDMARDIAIELDKWLDKKIDDYCVVINHYESIHSHNAVCIINAGRTLK